MRFRTGPRRSLSLAALALGLSAMMAGCLGSSDDTQGSGYASGTGAPGPEGNGGLSGQGNPQRQDPGVPTNPSTTRADDKDRTRTGGLGTASHKAPGVIPPKTDMPDASGSR